tara:strand:+ start:321 stop:497 length:177 start_codon:yes stop_codon:yes gene_type:complete
LISFLGHIVVLYLRLILLSNINWVYKKVEDLIYGFKQKDIYTPAKHNIMAALKKLFSN